MVNPLFVDPGITKEIGPVSEQRTDRGIRRVKDVPGEDPQEMVADLFERYHAAIFAYLYRLLGDRESANDLTQETFVKVYETRNRLPGVDNRRAWVYRIATNLAINANKRGLRFRWLSWQQGDALEANPLDSARHSETRLAVEQALAALPADYRAPLLLYSHDGWSVEEVAAALGISKGAVKTRLYRAREMFRRAYAAEVEP